ncbi:MAG: hypothetical protein OEP45_03540 [Acidobacteriota bacterium]|nr:hypothetical protein [Acidobacteriota bacterium]
MAGNRPGWGSIAMAAWAVLEVVAVGWLLQACGSAGSNGSPPPDVTQPPVEAPRQVACDARDELACLDSSDCTLRQAEDKTYYCAEPASACEEGFVQSSATAEACVGEGCTFVPAVCYCAPDVTCVCGGGPPAQCVAAS